MKPLIALLGFMLSTVVLFLQPTPNPEKSTDFELIQKENPGSLDTYDLPVEYFTEATPREIL